MTRHGPALGSVPLPDAVYVAYPTGDGRHLLSGRLTQERAINLCNTHPGATIIEADDRAEAFQRAADQLGTPSAT